MSKEFKYKGFATRSLHVGNTPDAATGAISPPIFQTSTYVQTSPGVHTGYEYSRTHNPTRTRLQDCLASLENAKYCIMAATGLAATNLIMYLMPKGSTILCGDDVYGGTYRLFTTVLKDNFNFIFADSSNLDNFNSIIKASKPSLIWIESPSNPLLKICDIAEICKTGKSVGALTAVDNTFCSPYLCNPLDLGADFVHHSVSKYINGHSDVVAGALMLNDDHNYKELARLQNSTGPSQSPFDSWLVLRGVKTLAARMEMHQKNAQTVAEYLEKHPMVERVTYPGLKSHPHYELAKKQMKGPGGMITFYIKGGLENARKFFENVNIYLLAESLGGVESLIESPAIMTHASIPKAEREKIGLTDNLIRVSVGIEDIEDLIADLEYAFGFCG